MKPPRVAIAVFVAAVAAGGWLAARGQTPQRGDSSQAASEEVPPPAQSEAAASGARFVGSASCTAANCHGGDGSRPVRAGGDPYSPQAYSLWIESDPHAGAFEVLYDAASVKIAERLGLPNAYTAPACLACHAVKLDQSDLTATARYTPHDGVGCEACHGAAERWLDAHKWQSWSSLSAEQKSALGFRDLKDLVARASACTKCHVGAAGQDVNHDLIAAGHPRMAFELSAYHANLPKHWKEEATSAVELDARLWLVGQATSAAGSLALLAERAANSHAPWPEFSEYDCFACHHDLADPSWRQVEFSASPALQPGTAAWGSWHFALAALTEAGKGVGAEGDLQSLRREMQRPAPRREEVRRLAEQMSRELSSAAHAAATGPMDAGQQMEWLRRLSAAPSGPADTWDAMAQRFLGCAAMNYSAQAAADAAGGERPASLARIDDALRGIRALLAFSTGGDEPRYDSPAGQTVDRRGSVREAFQEIHQAASAE